MLRSVPRRIEQVRLSISSLSVLPSPVNRRVGIHDFTFEACSSFTHVAACQIACPPIADVCPEAPTQSVTRPSRSVATMLIDIYMNGFSLHWRSAPLRRTVNYRVGRFVRGSQTNRATLSLTGLRFFERRCICAPSKFSGFCQLPRRNQRGTGPSSNRCATNDSGL
jgi:hypothetical protein